MGYVLPYDINSGFLPQIGFMPLGQSPTEEELEEFHSPETDSLERKRIRGLLRGGSFSDEHYQLIWDVIVFGTQALVASKLTGVFVVVGTAWQLTKIGVRNPWLAKPIGEYLGRTMSPVLKPIGKRMGMSKLGSKLDDLSHKPAIAGNPVTKSIVQSGAMGLKALGLRNRIEILDRMDLDLDVDLQELDEFLSRERGPDMRSRGPATGEDDMPYNRRTGQWYPDRKRYPSNRGGYGRRSYGGRSSGTGYGNYRQQPRRRSYRRW